MIESILVAIGDAPHEKNAFEYAAHLAILLNARLTCGFFHDGRAKSPENIVRRVLDETRATCEEYDLECEIDAFMNEDPVEELCQRARTKDLVVVGTPESIKTNALRLIYDQVDEVLLRITKPTIVVHEQCTLLEKVLAVYRGDVFSDRVLELSTEIAKRTNAHLIGLALAETRTEASRNAAIVREYLESHGMQPDVRDDVGFSVSQILDTAESLDVDLISVSASHHGKWYEVIFQSVTETVAKLANRAVLVAR